MNKRWLILIVIVVLAAFWWVRNNRTDIMHYRGETIKLSKSYSDFDEYKNDPNNIDPSETTRVQTLVITAPIAHLFASRLDVFKATQDIAFPGYGSGVTGGPQLNGNELFAVTIEIPRANKDRFIVFRGRNGRYELIDDFVHDEIPSPFGVREESGSYVFFNRVGQELFRRPAGLRSLETVRTTRNAGPQWDRLAAHAAPEHIRGSIVAFALSRSMFVCVRPASGLS